MLSRAEPGWRGERGRIGEAQLRRYAGPDIADWSALVCGPAAMVAVTTATLRRLGVAPAAIQSEGSRVISPNHQLVTGARMILKHPQAAVTVAALGALGLGGAAIAGAAGKTSTSSTAPDAQARPQREALSSDVAAKVKAAALDKVPGATVLRTEAGGPYSSAYHAHIKTSDGTLKVVLVNASFEATAVQADQGRGGGGPRRRPRRPAARRRRDRADRRDQDKVEAAVLAKYPGATIVRTETNADSSAPYESHIKTSDGKELEVPVSKDFEVVDAREHPAHP